MNIRRTFPWLVALLAAAPLLAGVLRESHGQAKRGEVMRHKLELSKKMLEELTMGDLDAVAGDATQLYKLGESVVQTDPKSRDDRQYAYFLRNFLRNCDDLGKRARARDLEGAAFAYSHMTVNCVECHRLVRDRGDK